VITTPDLAPGQTLVMTVRHGLTELNRDQRVGGQTDVPLLPEGRQQAEAARRVFEGTPLEVVVTSPLRRAVETAAILTGWPSERFVVDELCSERSFGQMEGLTRAQVQERFPQIVYLQIDHVGYSLNPPGGEPFEALRRRAEQFADRILSQHPGRRLLISSHQNFLQQLHGVLLGRDTFDALRLDLLNLELNAFHLGPERQLIAHQRHYLVPDAGRYASF
jgi:broad specificity phosphatase PhoE